MNRIPPRRLCQGAEKPSDGPGAVMAGGRLAGIAAAILVLLIAGAGNGQTRDNEMHIGVVSCAGDNCHGAVKRFPNSSVAQDEYLIWKQKDKHRLAYAVLGGSGVCASRTISVSTMPSTRRSA